MKRRIVGLTTTLVVSGGFGLAGLGLTAELAPAATHAQPGPAPQDFWCPGQPIPNGALWNTATCHTYHYVTDADGRQVAVQGPPPACGPNPC
jgi:hypothetical protein